jgi:hypothetical protein
VRSLGLNKELVKIISFSESWRLNHWGSDCAKIIDDKMVFTGTVAPNGTDGSHIDLIDFLEIGKLYEITCFAKSNESTDAQFQLWCHDNSGEPNGISVATPFKTPSTKGELITLRFDAQFNKNIRIHLQYTPGKGQIEISDIRLYQLNF